MKIIKKEDLNEDLNLVLKNIKDVTASTATNAVDVVNHTKAAVEAVNTTVHNLKIGLATTRKEMADAEFVANIAITANKTAIITAKKAKDAATMASKLTIAASFVVEDPAITKAFSSAFAIVDTADIDKMLSIAIDLMRDVKGTSDRYYGRSGDLEIVVEKIQKQRDALALAIIKLTKEK